MAESVDDLFALAPEEFTKARDALARSLKDAGDPDAAAEVKKLRRPNATAWTLNQLVRKERPLIEELLEAGAALRTAQRRAMSGVKDSGFREASDRRRELIQTLTRRASDILAEAGRGTQGADEEVGRSLESASVDQSAADELLQGRLERPLGPVSGFEAVAGFEVVPAGEPEEPADEGSDADREAAEVAVRNAERQAAEAEAEARRASMRAENLETQAKEIGEKAEEARAEADRLAERADEARSKLERAREELEGLG